VFLGRWPTKDLKVNISFFFPAFNDEGTVERMVVDAVKVLKSTAGKYEIIIVNDGSLDGTGKVADEMAKKFPQVKVVHHLYNIGYGAALKTGFATSKYELIFYTDGDHQFDPAHLTKLLPFIGEYDIVSGYRARRADSLSRRVMSKLYNFFVIVFLGVKLRDVDCAFKLLKRRVVRASGQYINNGAFICAELFLRAIKGGYKVKQVPIDHYAREYGKSSSFSFFFLLRSAVELLETTWELRLREKVHSLRRNMQRGLFSRKISKDSGRTGNMSKKVK